MVHTSAQAVLQQLEEAGYSAYLVGGCVRDLLLGKQPDDYDMTTSARPEEVLALFAPHAIPTGLQHGTVTVRWGGESFEITTFRADGTYSDGRHPDAVTFSRRLEDDLQRRDFTVNAMAMDRRGQLTDLYGGQEDLRRGVIRCVGNAETRFAEDALRIMRGLRFAAVLGFSIEEQTAQAMIACRYRLEQIAAERLQVEMTKLLCGRDAGEILLRFPQVIGVFMPEILPCVGFAQHSHWHCYDVWEHICRSVEAAPVQPLLRWTMLLHDIAKPVCFTQDEAGAGHFYGHPQRGVEMAREVMHRLRFDKRSQQRIETLIAWHDREIPRTEKGVRRALHALGEEALRQLIEVKRADNWAQHPDCREFMQQQIDWAEEIMERLLEKESCFRVAQLAVNGRDLLALGLQGSQIGTALDAALEQVLEGALPNEKESLLAWISEHKKP